MTADAVAADAVRDLLIELSEAFATHDVDRLMSQFSSRADVMYAGSEDGEQAVGPGPLRALGIAVLARPQTYSFEFRVRQVVVVGESLAVLADGIGTQTDPVTPYPESARWEPDVIETFRYRVVGTLVLEDSRWVWLVLSGSEPTPAL